MKLRVFSDGGTLRTNPGLAAAAAVVVSDAGEVLLEDSLALGRTTSNVAEYRGLLLGIRLAKLCGASSVVFVLDSQLVVNHVNKAFRVKDAALCELCRRVWLGLEGFGHWEVTHVGRKLNKRADWLCRRRLGQKANIAAPAIAP